jgi:hypothetical protein
MVTVRLVLALAVCSSSSPGARGTCRRERKAEGVEEEEAEEEEEALLPQLCCSREVGSAEARSTEVRRAEARTEALRRELCRRRGLRHILCLLVLSAAAARV